MRNNSATRYPTGTGVKYTRMAGVVSRLNDCAVRGRNRIARDATLNGSTRSAMEPTVVPARVPAGTRRGLDATRSGPGVAARCAAGLAVRPAAALHNSVDAMVADG